jgi:glycosyltransferase involved in cell wall biosynthesis
VANLKASIVLAFYNDTELLALVLDALKAQYHGQFEVLIADDGSSPKAVIRVEQMLRDCPFPTRHFWHADDGFRKTIIMNRAVSEAQGETLIFVDADCVPQMHFVDDHLHASQAGLCLAGRRMDVFRDAAKLLDCRRPARIVSSHVVKLLYWSVTSKARNVERGIRLPRPMAARFASTRWGLVGCNFSLRKSDLMAINGFDERHAVTWGAEDSDLQRRLLKAGMKIKGLRYQATMIHFDGSYFKRKDAVDMARHQGLSLYDQAAAEDRAWTPYGIIKEDRPDPRF